MDITDLVNAMERIAPPSFAEPWDNVGLLAGFHETSLGTVLLTIDLTERVLDEAIERKASAIVAYHPPLFHAVKRLTDADPNQRVLLRAMRAGISLYSPHTALDAAPDGVTDWLCEGLSGDPGHGAGDRRALTALTARDQNQELKLVTFVPAEHLERVRDAMATAGAGIVGAYRDCSFSVSGHGTFLGDEEHANPAIGQAGHFETVPELRLEMVCSRRALPLAVETLRQFHPYEEPAIDIYSLEPRPMRDVGPGRRIVLDQPASLATLAERLKSFLDVSVVKIAGDLETEHSHVGVCPGAGASLAGPARLERCTVFVTGEMRHHEVLQAVAEGQSVILAGHTNTERGYLHRLRDQLDEALGGVTIAVSTTDQSPLQPV